MKKKVVNYLQTINLDLYEDEDIEKNTTSLKTFHYLEDNSIEFSILETKRSTKQLDSGVYNLTTRRTNSGDVPDLRVSTDKELFNDDLGFYYEDKIKNIYNKFFDADIKKKVSLLGYNHKFGILLYGKQGTGKTSMFKKYFNDAVSEHKAIVFDIKYSDNVSVWWNFVQDIRRVQKNPIIIFLDEFEEYIDHHSDEGKFKKILDGTDSIDNCMFFMTTNYIDKIPETIKDRPSRIKYKIEVQGIQDEKIITQFLKISFEKVGLEIDFKNDVSKMKGWTIDELKQWVLDKIMDIEPEEKGKKKLGF